MIRGGAPLSPYQEGYGALLLAVMHREPTPDTFDAELLVLNIILRRM